MFSHQCVSLVLITIIHQVVNDTPSYKSGSTKKPSESSSTVPNLLASNGQLKEFPYSSSKASDKSEFDHIMGRSAVANGQKTNTILPVFPKGIQSYSEFSIPMVYEKSATDNAEPSAVNTTSNGTIPSANWSYNMGNKSFSIISVESMHVTIPEMQSKLDFLAITDTQLQCYISPPTSYVLNMEDLMGFWYMVRVVNSSKLTEERYVCEEVIYSQIGLTNTFQKVADVHYNHRWMTIHGNGTFISPGILVIDWKVLRAPTVSDRLVFTIIGADPTSWVVGFMCSNNNPTPEIVLQTRMKKPSKEKLDAAYAVMRGKKLHLNNMACQAGF